MRLAVAFPYRLLPVHRGKEMFVIGEGLRALGHDVTLHAPGADGADWAIPVRTAPAAELHGPAYWRRQEIDAGLVYSFLGGRRLLEAVRGAGARAVGKADTTGFVSARLHPRGTLSYALFDAMPESRRSLALAAWLASLGPLHRREVGRVAATVAASDALVVETGPARDEVARVLVAAGRADVASRLVVIPNPVAPVFTRSPLGGTARDELVVAAGRWEDPAKHAGLLRRGLRGFLAAHPNYRALVVGGDARRRFAGVHPRSEAADRMGQEELARAFGRARIVVSSSRWESFSLSSNEALAMGASVVGPDIPAFRQIAGLGPYASLFAPGRARSLTAALRREAAAWESGERNPVATAAVWRERLDVDVIVRRYEALLTA